MKQLWFSFLLISTMLTAAGSYAAEPVLSFDGPGLGDGLNNYKGISNDGSVMIVEGTRAGGAEDHIYRWANGVMTDLGNLGGTNAYFRAMTTDGAVIVGESSLSGNIGYGTFRWENGITTDLGHLGGGYTNFVKMSPDGTVIVGNSNTLGGYTHAYRWHNGTMTDLGSLQGANSTALDLSADGSVVAGLSEDGSTRIPFRWENGVMTDVSYMGGGESDYYGMSSDGSTIVGYWIDPNTFEAIPYRWKNGVSENVGTLGAGYNQVTGISNDGSVIVGQSLTNGNVRNKVFRWENSVISDIGDINDGDTIYKDMTSDGSVIVGESYTADNSSSRVFRWENAVMSDLGALGSGSSTYQDMTADASVVIGLSATAGGDQHVFHWKNGAMTDIETLGGSTTSYSAMTADGSVVIGVSDLAGNTRSTLYRWDASNGIQSVEGLLTTAGVDMTGWELSLTGNDYGISNNGEIIAGNALYNGQQQAFIFKMAQGASDGDTVIGITTPEALAQSVASAGQATQQAAAVVGMQLSQTLFQARNMMPAQSLVPPSSASGLNNMTTAAGGPQCSKWEVYSTGSFGVGQSNDFSNNDMNGTIGIKAFINPELAIGAGIIGSTARTDLAFEGQSKLGAYGVSTIIAYAPVSSGLRLYGSLFAAKLDIEMTRGYTNGSGLDSSQGNTNGFAYGAAAQAGWNTPITQRYSIMPYTELRWSKTRINGYAETGGAFAASFSSLDVNNASARLGIENSYALTDKVSLIGRVAYARRLNNSASGVTANISGLTQVLGNNLGDRNWGEASVGIGWRMSEQTYFTGELSARSGDVPEPAVSATVGLSYRF